MGMFDTFKFKNPFICEECEAEISEIQTKHFDNTLSKYTEGDFIYGGGLVTGVIEETLYCYSCKHSAQKIYISIWHSLYTGSFENYTDAEERIKSIEKTDLLDYVLFQQKRYVESSKKFNEFHGLMLQFSEYINDKNAFINEIGFLSIPKKNFKEYIVNNDEKDTLKKILEYFDSESELPDESIF